MGDNKSNQPEFITGLIELYRSHPCLWKIKSKNYSNRQMREKAYSSLLQYYKMADDKATLDTVKNKLNNLRSSFRKELKKVNKSKKSGSGSEEVYVPKLWYFKLLLFTSDQEIPLTPVSNDSDENDTGAEVSENEIEVEDNIEDVSSPINSVNEETSQSTDISITPVPSLQGPVSATRSRISSRNSTSSANRSASKRPCTEQRELVEKICNTLQNNNTDEYDTIGANVAYKFRRLNAEQRMYAEHLIHKVLFYAIQNKLTPDSDVMTGTPVTNQTPASNRSYMSQQQYQPYQYPQTYHPYEPYHSHQSRDNPQYIYPKV